jgi:hypothetical protein
MDAIAVDPQTGKKFTVHLKEIQKTFLDDMSFFSYSEMDIKRIVDSLDISADAKVIVHQIAKASIRVGQTVVKIGRKILDLVIRFFESYPNTSFGVILGFILSLLIGTIPVIGTVLGSFLGPLLIALGLLSVSGSVKMTP